MKFNKKQGAVALEYVLSAGILGALGLGLVFMNVGDVKKQQESSANNLRDDHAFIEDSKGSEAVMTTDIVLNTDIVRLNVGETFNLTASLQPSNLWNTKLIWEVYKNPSKINTTVSGDTMNLQIKAMENGISRIKVRSNDGSSLYKTIKVIVGNPVTFSSSQLNLGTVAAGDSVEMAVYAVPADYSPSKVQFTWSVEDGYEYATFNKNVNTLTVTPKPDYADGLVRVHATAYDVLYEEITEYEFTLDVMDIYNITYNYDGAADVNNPSTYTRETSTFTLKNPIKVGYTFLGWTGSNGATPSTSVTIAKGSLGDRSYTSNWRANVYTIHYAGNGYDGGSTASSTHTYDEAKALTANGYTRTGYTFDGWNTNADGSGTPYTDKQSVKNLKSADGDAITLYAQWKVNNYDLTYDPNKGTLPSGTVNPKGLDYNAEYGTLPSATRTGYNFNGWFTAATGGTKVSASTKMQAKDTTIYAQWTPITYSITYNLNGGKVSAANPSTYTIESANFTLNNPSKTGYTFSGWTGTGLGSATNTVTISKGSTGNREYTANWKANSYSYNIVYKSSSGAQLGTATVSKDFGTTNAITPKAFTGYTSPANQTVVWDSTTAKTITFTYTPITYTISYTMNGGTNNTNNPSSYTIETATITLKDPSKSNATFLGWTGANGSTAQSGVTIAKGSTGNKSYTANWRAWVNQFRCRYWGDYSGWTDTAHTATSEKQVSTRTMYRNWGGWSGWITTAHTATSEKQVSTRTTYQNWGSWTSYSDTAVSSSSTRQVQTRKVFVSYKMYRYKYWNSSANSYYYTFSDDYGGTYQTSVASSITARKSFACQKSDSGTIAIVPDTTNFTKTLDRNDGSCTAYTVNTFVSGSGQGSDGNWYPYDYNTKTQYRYKDLNTSWVTTAGSNGYNSRTEYNYRTVGGWETTKGSEVYATKTQYNYRTLGGWTNWSTTDCSSGYGARETRVVK